MEQHPVPQNVIDVEFKLFGSFTLKQFAKILFGCLGAFVLFLTPIPDLVKLPLMVAIVILGFGLAIVPNLGVWLMGYLKAIFVSPRYVWVRETRTPELLQSKQSSKTSNTQNVAKSTANKKVDISEIDLGQLFPTQAKIERESTATDNIPDPDKNNFLRVYQDVFKDNGPHKEVDKYFNEFKNGEENSITPQQTAISNESLAEKITRLKMQLSLLPKDSNFKMNEESIINEINELYSQMKVNNSSVQTDIKSNQVTPIKNSSENAQKPGKIIGGIVVDKSNNALAGISVMFKNLENGMIYKVSSLQSGKFSSEMPIPFGDYEISLQGANHKFHTYKINVGEQPTPLYKFRSI